MESFSTVIQTNVVSNEKKAERKEQSSTHSRVSNAVWFTIRFHKTEWIENHTDSCAMQATNQPPNYIELKKLIRYEMCKYFSSKKNVLLLEIARATSFLRFLYEWVDIKENVLVWKTDVPMFEWQRVRVMGRRDAILWYAYHQDIWMCWSGTKRITDEIDFIEDEHEDAQTPNKKWRRVREVWFRFATDTIEPVRCMQWCCKSNFHSITFPSIARLLVRSLAHSPTFSSCLFMVLPFYFISFSFSILFHLFSFSPTYGTDFNCQCVWVFTMVSLA